MEPAEVEGPQAAAAAAFVGAFVNTGVVLGVGGVVVASNRLLAGDHQQAAMVADVWTGAAAWRVQNGLMERT